MDQTRATTDGDGLAKHDRKHSLDSTEHENDHTEKEQDGGDPWAKVSAYSCTAGSTSSNDSSCSPTKLPHVELITHDPSAQVLSTNDAARQLSHDANAARNGESVLKRLAAAASPSGALDAAPLNSGFQSVAQVSLRPEASANKSASGFEAVPQTSTRTEVAQTNTAQTVDKSGVPVIRASDLVVKESTPGVKIEPTVLATNTTVARDLSSTTSGFQSVTQVALRTDGIVEKNGKVVSSEALVVTPIAPVTRAVYAPATNTAETTTPPISAPARVETTAAAPASTNKPASGLEAVAPTSANKPTSGFEAVPQNSTRTEVAQTNTTQTIDKSGVPVIRASDLVVKESTPGVKIEPTALATNTTVARDLSGPVAPAKDTIAVTSTLVAKDSNPATARVESAASTPPPNNKVEVASTSQVSGFQSVTQVALRTDGIVEKSGKVVSSEALVITPIAPVTRAVYAPTATTDETATSPISTPARVETTTVAPSSTNKPASGLEAVAPTSANKPTSGFEAVPQTSTRTEVAQTNTTQTVDKSGVPVVRASDLVVKESTPGVKIEPTALATNTTLARDLSSPTSGFQSVTQVALRTDGIVEKSGKVVSSEALVITPIAPVTRAVYAPAATTAETATSPISTPARVETTAVAPASTNKPASGLEAVAPTSANKPTSGFEAVPQTSTRTEVAQTNTAQTVDKSGVPVVRASDLVVKESTPGVKIEPTALATNTTLARDLSSPTSGFQSVTQVALRTDGIVEKSGKVISSEALVVTPIAPVTRAVYVPAATTAETATSPISTPARVETTAVAPASTNKPASGFEAVPQTSTRTEVAQTNTAQTVDKSGVPVIRASDLVVKESTPGVKIEPTALATNTTLARDLSSTTVQTKDTSSIPTSSKTEVPSSIPVSGFQSVASASLRPDAVVEKSGKIVSSEALVVTPIAPVTRAAYTPTAVTPEASVAATTSRAETTATAPAVDKSGVPVIRASDLVVKESTPGVKIEPTALATNTTLARDLSSTTVQTKDTSSIPTSSKTEVPSSIPVSGFQSVASASLRPDAVVEKSGKIVSSEALVVTPIAPVTRAAYTPTAVTPEASVAATTSRAETTATAPAVDKSGVPVIRASDLVVKESTPGVKIEPTSLATNTTVARDLNSTTVPTKDTGSIPPSSKTEVASSSPVSGFQSVASASLRPDGVVEKSGKIVSSEALVVAPIAPVTRAAYTPTAVTPEASVAATTSRAETTATAPAVDKSGVPVIRASDLVVKESTPGVKIEPTALATNTTVARDLNSTTVPTKDTGSIPPSSKTEVASSSPVSGFQSVASASLRPDGIVDKNGKTISVESFAVAPIVPVTKASASLTNSPASAAAAADTVSFTNQASGSKVVSSTDSNPQSTIRTDAAMAITTSAITSAVAKELTAKAEPTMRVLDNLQTAANSTAPKAIGTEHGQIGQIGQISQLNQLNQPTTALSAALAAAINGRMLGHQTETSKPFINGQGTAAMIDTSAVATTKGSIITVAANTKTEPGSGAGNRGEGVAPAKTDAVSVNAEIRFPLGTKVKKSETEEGDDDGKTTTATSAKVFGAGGNGGAGTNSGTGTTNTANGQVIDPSVAGMIGGTITPKPFDLPPLEITDKENENGRATKSNGSNNAANNSGNKVNGGPSQKEMSDALQALIEKRRKERTRKPVTSTGKKTPVYKPEKQRRCLVLKGDTLDSLAEQYLADSNLAELIYEINKGFWREKRRAGVVYLEFIPGSTIFLPTEEEIALFRRKKLEGGKPYLSFKCAPPKAVRSLRQSVKQNQQQQEATVELKLDLKLDLEPEQDTVVIAEAVPPTVFTANAPANSENSIEKALAVQLIAHLAQVSDTSRLLQPNQAKQVRELEETSRVTVVGEQSAVDATGYVARIEVLCENVWQPVMEYIIDGALGDATLKIYSLGGKVREIDLDLPLSIIREMAFNDLTANRLNYCKKYLLGRKIFC